SIYSCTIHALTTCPHTHVPLLLYRYMFNSTPFHFSVFFFNDTATTEIYTLSLHDALPICSAGSTKRWTWTWRRYRAGSWRAPGRSEEHTSELQSRENLVCRLLLEKKKKNEKRRSTTSLLISTRRRAYSSARVDTRKCVVCS